MIGQAHRSIADGGGEHLHQHGGNRAIDHRDIDHQDRQDRDNHRFVDRGAVRCGRITRLRQRSGGLRLPRGALRGERVPFQRLAVERRQRGFAHRDPCQRSGGRGFVAIRKTRARQIGFGDVAGGIERGLAHRIELEGAVGRIGDDGDGRALGRGRQARIGRCGQRVEQWEIGQRRQQAAAQNDGLAADLVRQPAEQDDERRADRQSIRDELVGQRAIDLQYLFQEEQRVELPRIPDHGLTGGEARQRQDHQLEVLLVGEGFGQRLLGGLAFLDEALEHRAFVQPQAYP